jgi:ClpP class serine protease
MNWLTEHNLAIDPRTFSNVIASLENDKLLDKDQILARNSWASQMQLVSYEGELFAFEDDYPSSEVATKSDGFVAVIPIQGVMQKQASMWYYSTGTERTIELIRMANEDPSIYSIMLLIESGGGAVSGTFELAEEIRQSAKPVIAVVQDICASAALWVASQCQAIYVTSPTAMIGSVGVMTWHDDISVYYSEIGLKRTYITSRGSELKVSGNEAEPLSEDAKRLIQENLDPIRSVFLSTLKSGRGEKLVDEDAAFNGLVYDTKTAKSIGLIDGQLSLEASFKKAHTAGRKWKKDKDKAENERKSANKRAETTQIVNNSKSNFNTNTMSNWFNQRVDVKTDHFTEPVELSAEVANKLKEEVENLENVNASLKNDLDAKASELDDLKARLAALEAKATPEVEEVAEEVEETSTNKDPFAKFAGDLNAKFDLLIAAMTPATAPVEEVEEPAAEEVVAEETVPAPAVEEVIEEPVAEKITKEVVAEEETEDATEVVGLAALMARLDQLEAELEGSKDVQEELQKENAQLAKEKAEAQEAALAARRNRRPKPVSAEIMEQQEEEAAAKETNGKGRRYGASHYRRSKLSTAGMAKNS